MIETTQKKIFNFDTFPQVKPANIYFDEVIIKLMEKTSFFQGLAKEVVFKSLQKIREVPAGIILLEENTGGCDFFYLLLKGNLGVYEKDIKIATISGVQIFGEIGFFNGKRIASVQTEEKSCIVKITREFIQGLDPKIQAIFFQNIAKELATKVSTCNGQYSTILKSASEKAEVLGKDAEKLTHHIQYDITRHL